MADDFRIRVDVEDAQTTLLERLGVSLDDEARELVRELESRRLSVSRSGDEVFVYASTYADAERASELVRAALRDTGHQAQISAVEQWLETEDRWSDEPPGETWEQEELEHGFAPWEVRVDCGSRRAAGELADRLEEEGYRPLRQWSYLIVGCESREDADALAARVDGIVEPGSELVWETAPGNPFAIFGGMGAAGAPGG